MPARPEPDVVGHQAITRAAGGRARECLVSAMSQTILVGHQGWLYRWLLRITNRSRPWSSITGAEARHPRHSTGDPCA
jgi:hypothetical protein